MNQPIEIIYCQGVEGNSLYLNDFRIIGNKPWGGGNILYRWKIRDIDSFRDGLKRALPDLFKKPKKAKL